MAIGKTYLLCSILSSISVGLLLIGVGLPTWDKDKQDATGPEIGGRKVDSDGIGNAYLSAVVFMVVGTATMWLTTFCPENGYFNGLTLVSHLAAGSFLILSGIFYASGDLNMNFESDNIKKWGFKGASMWICGALSGLVAFLCAIRTMFYSCCEDNKYHIAVRVAAGHIGFALITMSVLIVGGFTWKPAIYARDDPDLGDPHISPMYSLNAIINKAKAEENIKDNFKGFHWQSQLCPFVAFCCTLAASVLNQIDLLCFQSGTCGKILSLTCAACAIVASVFYGIQSQWMVINMPKWLTPMEKRWGFSSLVIGFNCFSCVLASLLFLFGFLGRNQTEAQARSEHMSHLSAEEEHLCELRDRECR